MPNTHFIPFPRSRDVEAFYCSSDPEKCGYLIVTDPYKPPYTSNDIFTPGQQDIDTSAEQVLGPLNEYNDLNNGFVTLAPTASPTGGAVSTAQPTKQPVRGACRCRWGLLDQPHAPREPHHPPRVSSRSFPSFIYIKQTTQPTKQPTTQPTGRPTFTPTPAPTNVGQIP